MLRVGQILSVQALALDGPLALTQSQDGESLRVSGLIPGDQARVRVDAVGRSGAFGSTHTLLAPSPHRVTPPCPIVDRCGGCPWQVMAYEEQLNLKHQALRRLFAGTPLEAAPLAAVEPTPGQPPLGFRDKIQMPAGGRAGGLTLGLWAPRSHTLIPVPHCAVQSALGERVRARLLGPLNQHGMAPWNSDAANTQASATPRGELRSVLLRVGDDGAYVTLVTRSGGAPLGALAEQLAALPEVRGVYQNINDTLGNRVLGLETRWLAGQRTLQRTVDGLAYELSAVGFFQTNAQGAAALLRAGRALLGPDTRRILDLYAGTGFVARGLVHHGATPLPGREIVAAVEADPQSGEVARRQLPHTRVLVEDVARLTWRTEVVDTVVADPPRKGLPPEVIAALAETGARRLLYVACAPDSVARDAPLLVGEGWHPSAVRPVDMFPHTPHVEAVVLFERTSS